MKKRLKRNGKKNLGLTPNNYYCLLEDKTMTDFSNYKVGDKIGVKPRYAYQEDETVVAEITGETPTLWVVTLHDWRGNPYTKKFKKRTGINSPKETYRSNDLFLCSEQKALDILKSYKERVNREFCQRQSRELGCEYSESFQKDLLALIEKHKVAKK